MSWNLKFQTDASSLSSWWPAKNRNQETACTSTNNIGKICTSGLDDTKSPNQPNTKLKPFALLAFVGGLPTRHFRAL